MCYVTVWGTELHSNRTQQNLKGDSGEDVMTYLLFSHFDNWLVTPTQHNHKYTHNRHMVQSLVCNFLYLSRPPILPLPRPLALKGCREKHRQQWVQDKWRSFTCSIQIVCCMFICEYEQTAKISLHKSEYKSAIAKKYHRESVFLIILQIKCVFLSLEGHVIYNSAVWFCWSKLLWGL